MRFLKDVEFLGEALDNRHFLYGTAFSEKIEKFRKISKRIYILSIFALSKLKFFDMKKFICLLFASALLFAGCKKDPEPSDPEVQSMKINPSEVVVAVGGTCQLSAVLEPGGLNEPVQWEASRRSVATVDENGLVKGVAKGKCIITATAGAYSAECTVEVVTQALIMNPENLGLFVGDSRKLSVTIAASGLASETIKWTSSQPAVATVAEDGTVNAVAEGSSEITATVGSLSVTCKVSVMKKAESVFVSTDVQNSNVLIEELTGVGCGYCPAAHKLCDQLVEANPGKIFAICVHAGSYANGRTPLFTTDEGNNLHNTLGVMSGYPSGYINRYQWSLNFNGSNHSGFGVPREAFQQLSQSILQKQVAKTNVAAKATIDKATRELKVTVQVCYTGEVTDKDGNYAVHVALIQNGIKGPQSGASSYYPEHWDASTQQYTHNHMLRKLLAGLNGEIVPYAGTGSANVIEKTYTYTVPEKLGVGSTIPAVLEDMEVICYVTKMTKLTRNSDGYTFDFPLPIDNVCKAELIFK